MNASRPRGVTDIDRCIASRIRTARAAANLTQMALASMIGVSFQQLQKYEKAADRITASRLYEIAKATRKPFGYFVQNVG